MEKDLEPRADQDQQRQELERAKAAAEEGDALGMLAALYRSGLLDGLKRRLVKKWRRIDSDEADWIVADSVDALYEAVRKRPIAVGIEGYLIRTANNKAFDYNKEA